MVWQRQMIVCLAVFVMPILLMSRILRPFYGHVILSRADAAGPPVQFRLFDLIFSGSLSIGWMHDA